MNDRTPYLAAHKGRRGRLLLELKRDQPLTASELAERHQVSANAVRRHLKELESEGLVGYEREQRGQGAPSFIYRLTERGEAVFPKRYDEALSHVLTFVAETSGREEVRRIFARRFQAHRDRLEAELGEATLEERLEAVVDLLSREGFMAEWSLNEGRLRIAEHNCAFHTVAERFPEICAAEADFLRDVLQTDVSREAYIPAGCNSCQYALVGVERSDEAANHAAEPPQ